MKVYIQWNKAIGIVHVFIHNVRQMFKVNIMFSEKICLMVNYISWNEMKQYETNEIISMGDANIE